FFKRGLLDDSAARRHQQVMIFAELAHWNHAADLLLRFEREHVGNRPAQACSAHLRTVVDLEPVELALVGEAKQIGVRRRDEEMLDEVVFAGGAARYALATAVLAAIGVQR